MKKTAFVCAAALFIFQAPLFSAEFSDKGGIIAVDFPSGWTQGKSDDPAITLKLEKGKATFEFAKQDSELSDYYLKARVKENVESLRSKGAAFSGDMRPVSLHGVTQAYSAAYEMMGSQACMAFFTYNGASYSVSARNVGDADFRAVLASIRKPGEKIELPKKPKAARRKVIEKEEPEEAYEPPAIYRDPADASTAAVAGSTDTAVSTAAAAAAGDGAVSDAADAANAAASAAADHAGQAAKNFLDELARNTGSKDAGPYFPRKPLPIVLVAGLIAAWFFGSMLARGVAATYKPPKLSPPPAEVPPDFFFPFMIVCDHSATEAAYGVTTRQKQQLTAYYPYSHELWLAGSVYAALFFHALWSLLGAFGYAAAVTGALLWLPGGRFAASVPEALLLPFFAYGLYLYFTKKRILTVFDGQNNLVLEGRPEMAYCLLKDGAGKEVARLIQKEQPDRRWEFVDVDNVVLFSIKNDFPQALPLRKLFGHQGGKLRARYGIYVQDRQAGFVFLDPNSPSRFQIHMDFDFARVAPPAQILAALLYIISRERDPFYPSPF